MKVQGDPTGNPIAGFLGYDLAVNAAITSGGFGPEVAGVASGSYLLAITVDAWNGAALKVQFLGPDGGTWMDAKNAAGDLAQLSANGQTNVVVGGNATLRLAATGGAPSGVYAKLS